MKIYALLLVLLVACSDRTEKKPQGERLAQQYCGSCHIFPEPKFLDKEVWRKNVLPAMAKKLNIDNVYEMQLDEKNVLLSIDEWKQLAGYYLREAPDSLPGQGRPRVSQVTSLFEANKLTNTNGVRPSISYVGITDRIYAADAADSSLTVYDASLKKITSAKVGGVLVDMSMNTDLKCGIFTLIGIMPPNDLKTGSVDSVYLNEHGNVEKIIQVIGNLPRPVATVPYKNIPTAQTGFLVSAFGNNNGGLYLIPASDTSNIEILNPSAGAIKAYTGDFNHDGISDIIALTAQSRESIDIYYGTKDNRFDTANVLRFPPIYGSTFFELADFNADGYPDILYTCGDNADYTGNTLKYYHGVYIYLNDGNNHFSKRYFFPQHGTIKAVARDFDGDGDLDIAAISFFPDLKNQPGESFVYLENKGNFSFAAYTIAAADEGRWMTMDAGDVDGDGDDDILLGSMILPSPNQHNSSVQKGTSLLLLKNKTSRTLHH
jgi:hypothetical protein